MTNPLELKSEVKNSYKKIAEEFNNEKSCCCGSDSTTTHFIMSDDYSKVEGYFKDADMGLGCGIPTEYAGIKSGQTVLDLGAGAGNDVFVARRIVGDSGKVIGLDMTEEMLEKANQNLKKLGYDNVSFIHGEIEEIPLEDNSIDVVISNCVLNLVPNKSEAFKEIHRVLKPEGTFCVSDIIIEEELPKNIRTAAEMYAGCVSGAIFQDEYLSKINQLGFKNVKIESSKKIDIPTSILKNYLTTDELINFKDKETPIKSITVTGVK